MCCLAIYNGQEVKLTKGVVRRFCVQDGVLQQRECVKFTQLPLFLTRKALDKAV